MPDGTRGKGRYLDVGIRGGVIVTKAIRGVLGKSHSVGVAGARVSRRRRTGGEATGIFRRVAQSSIIGRRRRLEELGYAIPVGRIVHGTLARKIPGLVIVPAHRANQVNAPFPRRRGKSSLKVLERDITRLLAIVQVEHPTCSVGPPVGVRNGRNIPQRPRAIPVDLIAQRIRKPDAANVSIAFDDVHGRTLVRALVGLTGEEAKSKIPEPRIVEDVGGSSPQPGVFV